MVNIVWLILIVGGFLVSVFTGQVEQTSQSAFGSAKYAVELGIGLIGIYSLWLGLMRVAEKSGLVNAFSKKIAPVLRLIFREVPAGSPAMGAMSMNIIANMLGLGNAATPLGIKAMKELEKLNRNKKSPSDAMCLFLIINTASVQLIPTTVIALRSAAASSDPAEIVGTTLIATICAATAGIVFAKLLKRYY
ncbi:MAG: nucleoside recognition domain-containing protein [Caldicoprobacterales bacterium]|jgi:spore maturation protein A|nr:nucleoside recognition protein [Clostridiales bacterium]